MINVHSLEAIRLDLVKNGTPSRRFNLSNMVFK